MIVTRVTPAETVAPVAQIQWLLYGVIIAIACILVGVGITYMLLRSKPSK